MGSPRRNRKKYHKPAVIWDKQRIEDEHKLKDTYGLKNLRELWKATSEIRKIRRNVREVLSGKRDDTVGREVVSRLSRYNIVSDKAILDDLLVIKPEAILERRLQTIVLRKGLARSMRQSRQLITHGFIAINGKRVRSPGYLIRKDEESEVIYYKPINIGLPAGSETSMEPQPAQQSEAAKVNGGEGG